jgi:2-hydroxychromene-2-carboxylate isomerase
MTASAPVDVRIYFNFRSPYCYLATQSMFEVLDGFDVTVSWHPFGGWSGRSDPERAKKKIPLVRQDVKRWCNRLAIPFTPPPLHTDPTRAGAGSLLAEEKGLLRPYVKAVMNAEWAEGEDIGDAAVLADIANRIGLDVNALLKVIDAPAYLARLQAIWAEGEQRGVFGVPTFIVNDQIFWGNDRIDFLVEYLTELGLRR